MSEEGRRHKDETSAEIETIRRIAHKNGSAAEVMAGGLAELEEILRENRRERDRDVIRRTVGRPSQKKPR